MNDLEICKRIAEIEGIETSEHTVLHIRTVRDNITMFFGYDDSKSQRDICSGGWADTMRAGFVRRGWSPGST